MKKTDKQSLEKKIEALEKKIEMLRAKNEILVQDVLYLFAHIYSLQNSITIAMPQSLPEETVSPDAPPKIWY